MKTLPHGKMTEIAEQNKPAGSKLPNKALLQKFTVLAEGNDDERIRAVKIIIDQLTTRQTETTQGLSDDVKYAVNRLVQGLSSGRKFARLGFSAALCQILRTVRDVSSGLILACMEEKANSLLEGKPSKSVVGNVSLGKAFCLLTLIHSHQLFKDDEKYVGQVVEQFLALMKERSYLPNLCYNGIVQIISQVSGEVFKKQVLSHVKGELSAGWTACTPDRLLLVLFSQQYHKSIVKKLLKEHWSDERVICEETFPKLAEVVLKCCQSHTGVHSVIDEVLKHVQNTDVVKFWKTVCRPLVAVKSHSGPKRTLAVYIFQQLLPFIDTDKKMKEILQPDIVTIVSMYNVRKTDETGKQVITMMKQLTEHMAQSTSTKFQLSVVKCFMKEPGSCLLDKTTGAEFMANIINQLGPEARSKFSEELFKAFIQKPSWIIPADSPRLIESLQWCSRELTALVTHDNTDSASQTSTLQFLLLHSYFNVRKTVDTIPQCEAPAELIPEFHRKYTIDCFTKALAKIVAMNTKGQSRLQQFNQHIDVLYDLVIYTQTLLNAGDDVMLVKEEDVEQLKGEWDKLVEVLQSLNKKRQSAESIGEYHAFELLFIYTGLQLLGDFSGTLESMEDLHVCHKKSAKRRKSIAKDDGPAWIEVITELLLSMMFKEAVLSRNIAKVVMTALADHVTPTATMLIVDALKQTSLDAEEGMVGVEEVDEDGDDDDDDDDNTDNLNIDADEPASDSDDDDSDNDDDEEDDSDDSGIEEEDNMDVTEDLKAKVKAALGDAADDSSDESEENEEPDVELTDNEMFKLDKVLAAAFQGVRSGIKLDKNRNKQLNTFKIRVLDLAESLIKSHPTTSLVKSLIVPLLKCMEIKKQKQGEEALRNRAHGVLLMLCKVKKFEAGPEVDNNELIELLQTLMKYTSKVSLPSAVNDVGKACNQVIHMITEPTGLSPLKTRAQANQKQKTGGNHQEQVVGMIREGLLDLFQRKPGHCPPALFHVLINRFTLMLWGLTKDLIDTVASPDVKVYQKTQAASMLVDMVNKQTMQQVGEEEWQKFYTTWSTTMSKVLGEMDAGDVKKMYVQELLAVCHRIHTCNPEIKIFGEEDIAKLELLRPQLNQEGRSHLNKLVPKPQQQQDGEKKKKKKRKHEEGNDVQSLPKKSKPETHNQSINDSAENEPKVSVSTPKSDKKKKRKSKEKEGMNVSTVENGINGDNAESGVNSSLDKSLNEDNTDNLNNSSDINDSVTNGDGKLSSEKKKKNKRKSAVNESIAEENETPSKSKKKKHGKNKD